MEFSELISLTVQHAPSLTSVLELMRPTVTHSEIVHCLPEWQNFLLSLACASPVCSLVAPKEALHALLRQVVHEGENIRKCAPAMEQLQAQVPVLFELVSTLPRIPVSTLSPIIERLVEKSKAPFANLCSQPETSITPTQKDSSCLAFFPSLPQVRSRNSYYVDKQHKQRSVCTKNSSGHPTLLPGTFTLYCQHG